MPFNREQRSWVYRAAKNLDNTVAFGLTRDLKPAGTVLFVNCPFPTLEEDALEASNVTIGPYARQPYTTNSIFNISGMSYGAISGVAVNSLSNGARMAGCRHIIWPAPPILSFKSARRSTARVMKRAIFLIPSSKRSRPTNKSR